MSSAVGGSACAGCVRGGVVSAPRGGCRRSGRSDRLEQHQQRPTAWQTASFAGGLVLAFMALVSPLDAASSALLSAHMLQHVLLILGVAPLLAISQPLGV